MATTESITASRPRRFGPWLYGFGIVLFAVAFIAGIVQAWRIEKRLPSIDLFASGSREYIDLLISENKNEDAIEQLQMQLRMELPDVSIRERLGNLLLEAGRPEEARSQFEEVLKQKPESAEAQHALGSTYLATGQPELAVPHFIEAATLDPKSATCFNSLGVAMASLGRLIEAEKCFAAAVELAPDFADAQVNLERARSELELTLPRPAN